MLALARKVNESIMIGNDIEITVLEIKGDQIKLGVKLFQKRSRIIEAGQFIGKIILFGKALPCLTYSCIIKFTVF